MSFVLTESSTLVCAHPKGLVKLTAGQSRFKVQGAKVLVDGDLNNASIGGCLTPLTPPPPGPTNVPCTQVTSVVGGVATKLKVQGKGVLLDSVQGFTNGTLVNVVNQPWSVQDAGEPKVKAT